MYGFAYLPECYYYTPRVLFLHSARCVMFSGGAETACKSVNSRGLHIPLNGVSSLLDACQIFEHLLALNHCSAPRIACRAQEWEQQQQQEQGGLCMAWFDIPLTLLMKHLKHMHGIKLMVYCKNKWWHQQCPTSDTQPTLQRTAKHTGRVGYSYSANTAASVHHPFVTSVRGFGPGNPTARRMVGIAGRIDNHTNSII